MTIEQKRKENKTILLGSNMSNRVEEINPKILQECRLQSGLTLAEVGKKVNKIKKIEGGSFKPTFNQLDILSHLYNVPRWVFISKQLPDKYQFTKSVPAFRQFVDSNPDIFEDSKVRGLVTRIERYRNLVLDLLDDMGEPLPAFQLPNIEKDSNPTTAAEMTKSWLGISKERYEFADWKIKLEEKNIFIFLTSKFKDWSNIDKMQLRGLSLYHDTLPIIIINNSDAKKAQTFTLFHELGHIIKKENSIDDWFSQKKDESWCDDFAGEIIMPKKEFQYNSSDIIDIDSIKEIAKLFKVSPYACLVRLRRLNIIQQKQYEKYEEDLKIEFAKLEKLKKLRKGGPARNRVKEIIQQYGHIYTNALFQAYHNKEIGLHKLTKLLDLKKSSYVFEIEAQL
jgi:Zn-dependent peptidase ImmA (M78 family)